MKTYLKNDTIPAEVLESAIRIQTTNESVVVYEPGDTLPVEPESLPTIPDVSAWQFIQALAHLDLLTAVEAYVAASSDPMVAYGWSRASTFARRDPFVLAAQATLGMSDAQADELFLLAASK